MALRTENEAILLNLGYNHGVAISPRRVDFSLVFPDEYTRSSAKADVCGRGFDWEDQVEAVEGGTFEAIAAKVLAPAVDAITDSEATLIECLAPFEAYVDGWGFFRDSVH